MSNVCMCARFQVSPREFHFKIIKIILRYLNETSHHGIYFPKGRECSLVGFVDYNFVEYKVGRKSTSGTYHIFRNCLVSWNTEKQHRECSH